MTPSSPPDLDLGNYRGFFELCPDAFCVAGLDGRLLRANASLCAILGVVERDLVGKTFPELVAAEDREDVRAQLASVAQGGVFTGLRTRLKTARGTATFLEWSGICLVDDGIIHAAARDMTQPREGAELLEVSEARYRALFEHAPVALVVLDMEKGCFSEVNAEAEALFKLERQTLTTLNPVDLSPPTQPDGRRSAEAAQEVLGRAMAGETPRFEWVHRDAEGNDVLCEVRLLRMPAVGQQLVRGSITDISARRQLEEQLQHSGKMEAIGKLAGGVAHDFNNILTVINSYAALTLGGLDPDSPVHGYVEEIRNAGIKAANLTTQLLALGRKQVTHPCVLDLNAALCDLIQMLRCLIGEDVDLRTEFSDELLPLEIDPTQLEQVVLNLVVNSRDAMPQGGQLIISTSRRSVGAAEVERDPHLRVGDFVQLTVADTGRGISLDVQKRMYEPFFTTKAEAGTGLGLATVYAVVQQNRGLILVDSAPDEGARFEILFPASSKPVEVASTTPAAPAVGHGTVLLVEDDDGVRDLLAHSLETMGYQVISAAGGDDAIQQLEAHLGSIDLLITDVIMPRMSGMELSEKIRRRRPGTPVLLISGYTDDLIPPGTLRNGTSFLPKPFTPKQLGQKLRELLKREPTPV